MLGHRTNFHCMLSQLAAELCTWASLCGIATLAPLTRHLGSDTRHGLPSSSPECHRYPEAMMAECGSIECRRLAEHDNVSITNVKIAFFLNPSYALCKAKCKSARSAGRRHARPRGRKTACHYDIPQTSATSRHDS